MSKQEFKAVGDKDPTNFPKKGDNKKVSLRNSEYKLFPVSYAEKLKEEHPDVWALGGNIEGNNQYRRLVPISRRGGGVETKTEEMAVRKREAWAARHLKDFRIAGTIAQVKWLVVGQKGLGYMKNLIQAEITRRKDSDERAKKDLGKKSNAKQAMDELSEKTQKSLKEKGKEHNDKYGDSPAKKIPQINYLAVSYHRGLGAYDTNPQSVRPTVTSASQWAMARVNGLLYALKNGKFKRKPYDTDLLPPEHPESAKKSSETEEMEEEMSEKLIENSKLNDTLVIKSSEKMEDGTILHKFSGKLRASIPISGLASIISENNQQNSSGEAEEKEIQLEQRHIKKVEETEDSFIIEFGKSNPDQQEVVENLSKIAERSYHHKEDEEDEDDEKRVNEYLIEGIASSTSIDSHGTEMARNALQRMAKQIKSGVPILPSHASHNANGIGEWDEVIGRTVGSDIVAERNVKNAADKSEQQYLLKVRSVLYKDEPKTQALLRRLGRGEPIGQSIGGWFEDVEVIEQDGNIQRVIVNDVTLDHIAITRAPSNPDSINLMTLSMRSKLQDMVQERKAMPAAKFPLADMEMKWDWSTEAANEVLGDPPDWKRYAKAHLYVDPEKSETKSGYKLPVAKMIDGKLTLVFRGVVAAMSALNGARGGVDVPDSEREKIYKTLERYYKMFDKEPPPMRSEEEVEFVKTESVEEQIETQEEISNKSEQETVVDTRSETGNNEAVESIADNSATTNKSSGEDMTENDLAKFAEMLKGALAPIAERVAALEATPKAEAKEEKVEVRNEEPAEMLELRRRLEKAETMITRVIETPIRRGSHRLPRSGIIAEDMYTRTADACEKEGLTVLPKLVKRHAEQLSDKNNKLSKNDLTDMLAQGLRAAEMDGLLNHSTNTKLWQ